MKVAVVQMCSGTEPVDNLAAIETAVADAAGQGASYILTPEMSVAFAANRDGLAGVAEPFEGNAALARCAGIAREHAVSLHIGSLAVALGDGQFANRSVLLAPDGTIAASYDKIHLFDATLPGQSAYRESATYRGGDKAVTVSLGGTRLGLTVCYDLRFPALFAALATAGAGIIAVPSAFTVPTGEAHWEILLRARAIETGAYVIAAAQGGVHQNRRATYGHSMIVDPWGAIVAQFDHDRPGVLVAEIDPARVTEARARVPALANGRSFSLSVNPLGAS